MYRIKQLDEAHPPSSPVGKCLSMAKIANPPFGGGDFLVE